MTQYIFIVSFVQHILHHLLYIMSDNSLKHNINLITLIVKSIHKTKMLLKVIFNENVLK